MVLRDLLSLRVYTWLDVMETRSAHTVVKRAGVRTQHVSQDQSKNHIRDFTLGFS